MIPPLACLPKTRNQSWGSLAILSGRISNIKTMGPIWAGTKCKQPNTLWDEASAFEHFFFFLNNPIRSSFKRCFSMLVLKTRRSVQEKHCKQPQPHSASSSRQIMAVSWAAVQVGKGRVLIKTLSAGIALGGWQRTFKRHGLWTNQSQFIFYIKYQLNYFDGFVIHYSFSPVNWRLVDLLRNIHEKQ